MSFLDPATYLIPLQQPFMQRAFFGVVLVGILCAVVGSFVVLRGLAFTGEAMRHALFTGVVIAFLFGGSLLVIPLVFALAIAWLINVLGQQHGISEDTAVGVMFSGAFALGIVLLNFARTGVRDLTTILLGDVLGLSGLDLLLTAAVTLVVLGLVTLFWKEFVLTTFDRALAAAQGRSLLAWDGLLLVLVALALVTAFQTVGNLLVLALLLAPAASARQFTNSLLTMMSLAAVFALSAGVVGLYLSYWISLPSGPTIVLLCGAIFGCSLLFAPGTGSLWEQLRRRRMRRAA